MRKQGHYLSTDDFSSIPDLFNLPRSDAKHLLRGEKPELVIIGAGYSGVMQVNSNVEEFFKTKGIEIIIQKTIDAWKTYNELNQSKKIIALFHLTC
jgi:hypothetical protein